MSRAVSSTVGADRYSDAAALEPEDPLLARFRDLERG